MSDGYPPPPARDLHPGRLDQRSAHLRSEITHGHSHRPVLPSLAQTLAVAACALLAAGLAYALIPTSSGAPSGGFAVQGLTLAPDDGVIGSNVKVSVSAPIAHGSLEIKVIRVPNQPGTDPAAETSQVVYQDRVPMTEVYPGGVANGDSPRSTWSGSLSTSDWAGGCASRYLYAVEALATESASGAGPGSSDRSRWFSCQPITG